MVLRVNIPSPGPIDAHGHRIIMVGIGTLIKVASFTGFLVKYINQAQENSPFATSCPPGNTAVPLILTQQNLHTVHYIPTAKIH